MLNNLLSLFLESRCALCERSTPESICEFCQRQLYQCALNKPGCCWHGDLPLFAWGDYRGPLKRAIATLKYHNCPQLGELLGCWLAKAWVNTSANSHCVAVPIPLHAQKLKTRGYNQAAIIARSFCQYTNASFQPHGLVRTRETQAMYELSREQRESNLRNAFSLGTFQQQPPAVPVLLVDDVYTTGATVRQAAQVLRRHDIKVLGAATVSLALREGRRSLGGS
ncbi:MAG: ComF family protein [Cyanophyceae cyanobacterium]